MTEELLAVLAFPHHDPEWLYESCYVRDCRIARDTVVEGGGDLTAALAAANRSRERWDDHWRIVQPLDEGRVLARKGGAARSFYPGQYITLRGPGPVPEKDERIRVFQAAGSSEIQSGFYFAFGETVSDFDEFEDILRLYWNISQAGAPLLMSLITGELHRFSVPFRFKCGQRPDMFLRRDPAVLYFPRTYYAIVSQVAARIHLELDTKLRDSVPLFTRRLARGLALAEDTGVSFGRSRCAILSEAMAATQGSPVEHRLAALRRSFEARGLSLDEPWRNPGSHSPYPFPFTDL